MALMVGRRAGPTWSSTGSESTCAAVQEACKQLRGSLAAAMADVGGSSAAAAWRSGLAKVHGDPGIFPATVLLSAYGFFDGTQRGEECNSRAPVRPCGPPVVICASIIIVMLRKTGFKWLAAGSAKQRPSSCKLLPILSYLSACLIRT